MSVLLRQYEQFIEQGFDKLGAIVMVIDGQPEDERLEPTIELIEAIGYSRVDSVSVNPDEFNVVTPGGNTSEQALRVFFVNFMIGKQLIKYQPVNRCLFRGKRLAPHQPESDFRFADWYPTATGTGVKLEGRIEDQIADGFPNAATAAQFLHEQGFRRSNTHKKLACNTYFVAARHGDGQPSGIVFRGDGETFFYDFYSDNRYVMGASGLLKEYRPTQRQLRDAMSIASASIELDFGEKP